MREGIDLHVRETGVEVVLETRGEADRERLVARLREAGYPVDELGEAANLSVPKGGGRPESGRAGPPTGSSSLAAPPNPPRPVGPHTPATWWGNRPILGFA